MTQQSHSYLPKRNKKKYLYANVHRRFIHNREKLKTIRISSTGEWVSTAFKIQTMEYYSIIKRNKILIHVKIWADFTSSCEVKKATHIRPHANQFHLNDLLIKGKIKEQKTY